MVGALTSQTVVELVRQAGLRLECVERFNAAEILVRASNPGFGTAPRRLRRRAARMLHGRPVAPSTSN